MKRKSAKELLAESFRELAVRLYCYGTVMLTCDWILGKYPVSSETLTEVYESSLPELLRRYFVSGADGHSSGE